LHRNPILPYLVALCCLLGVPAFAEDSDPELPNLGRNFTPIKRWDSDRPFHRKNLFKRVAGDQKFLVTTWWPAEARRLSFSLPLAMAVTGATQSSADAGSADLQLTRNFEGWSTGNRRGTAEFFTAVGDAKTSALILGSTYLVSRWAGNNRLERTTSLSGEALINTAIYVSVLKKVTRRTRPASGGNGGFFISSPIAGQESTSFPSGHAAGAFAVAAVIAGEYYERRLVAWLSYGTASMIALSRVALGRHFPSDILAGAILGQSIGQMVTYRATGLDDSPSQLWKRFRPHVDSTNGGFGVIYQHSWK